MIDFLSVVPMGCDYLRHFEGKETTYSPRLKPSGKLHDSAFPDPT